MNSQKPVNVGAEAARRSMDCARASILGTRMTADIE
jgi:hypothetical protein